MGQYEIRQLFYVERFRYFMKISESSENLVFYIEQLYVGNSEESLIDLQQLRL